MKYRRRVARQLFALALAGAAGGCFLIIDPDEYDTGIGREGGGPTFGFDDLDASDAKADASDARDAADASAETDADADASDADADDVKDAEDEFG